MDNQLFVIYGDHPGEMTKSLLDIIKPAAAIPQGAKIGIKPNLVAPKAAASGATTHPEVVEQLVVYLQQNGFNDIVIMEGAAPDQDTAACFKACGYEDISQKYGVPLLDLKKDAFVDLQAQGQSFAVAQSVLNVDYLIAVPVLKGNLKTKLSCALKDIKGCVADDDRQKFMTGDLDRSIALLNTQIRADLVLADAICGDLDDELGGNPFHMHRLLCASDSVLLDAYAATLLGYKPADIPYIGLAAALGVGSDDLAEAEIVELNSGFVPTVYRAIMREGPLFERIKDAEACSICYANLAQALLRLAEEGLTADLPEAIFMGKDLMDVESWGIGVGSCAAGFGDILPGCPPSVLDIKDYLRGFCRKQ